MATIGRVKPYVYSGTDPDPNAVILRAPGFPPPTDTPQPSDLYLDVTNPNASALWVYGFAQSPTAPSWTLASSATAGVDEVWVSDTAPVDPALELWVDTLAVGSATGDEVWVGATEPTDPGIEIWHDTSDDPGTLKVKVGGVWQNITQREVFVDDEDPLTRPNPSPEAELWYDTSVTPHVLKANVSGTWEVVSTGTAPAPSHNEVLVSQAMPRDVLTELWVDTGFVPGRLKYNDPNVGWITIAGGENEFYIGSTDPYGISPNATIEVWYDTNTSQLKVRLNDAWVVVSGVPEPPLDEVWVGAGPPDPVGTYEIWIDNTVAPAVARYKDTAGSWNLLGNNEVVVGTTDPYLDLTTVYRPELWHDTSLGQNGMLKVRIGNDWRPVGELAPDEVHVSATDPITANPQAELWIDTSLTPVALKARVNNGWVTLSGSDVAVPEEVNIGPVDPRDTMVELWYDTTASPGTLKANNFGTWEPIGAEEVVIGNIDPYVTDPQSTAELWFNPGMQELSARVNDQWLPAVPAAANEFTVQVTEPTNPDVELWFDISTDPGTLKVKVHQEWVPITQQVEPPLDEVWVGAGPPDPVGTYEVWYDDTVDPGLLRIKRSNGEWEQVATGSEVEIGNIDPYAADPTSVAELWFNPGMQQLSARVNDQWLQVAPDPVNEFVAQVSEPTNPDVELWFDTSTEPGTLKVKVAQEWVPVSGVTEPPMDEVWVGAGPPDPVGTYEIWYDDTVEPGVLRIQRSNGEWEQVATGSEVEINNIDPYLTDPTSTAELWFNPSMGELSARVNDQWITASPAANEFTVQGSEPTNPDVEMWFDISTDPPVLKAKVAQEWVPVAAPVEPQLDEVWVGAGPPDPVGNYEVWYDDTVQPGVLKFRRSNGEWETVASGSEVEVTQVDPYVTDPESAAELWFDPGMNKLWARVNDQWIDAAPEAPNEFTAQVSEPSNPDVELWLDLSQNPAILKAKVNQVWQPIQVPDGVPPQPLNEVHIGPSQPSAVETELWYDNSTDPGVLKANVEGVWTPIASDGSEVEVGHTDPYTTDPESTAELWYDTGKGVPGTLYVRTAADEWVSITPYGGVAYEQQYGQAPQVGVLNAAAHADHSHGTPPEEVVVNDDDPYVTDPDSGAELWYDASSDPGILKVRVNGAWEPVSAESASEIEINNIDPYLTDPSSTAELWFDPSMGTLSARVNDQWLDITGTAPNEFTVQGSQPTNPEVEMWYDISTDPGVLKVKVQQQWVPATGATDEVFVSDDEPVDPDIELWYDTDAVATRGPSEIPPGGLTHQALTKRTDQDGEVEWSGPHLKLTGGDLTGPVTTDANAPITAGAPIVANAPVTINEQLNMGSGDKIQFPNVTGPKIHLYSTTFGLGVESGETSIFASSKVGFHTNTSNGALFGYIDANTGGGLIIDRDNCDARYAPIADRYTAGDINGVAVTAGQYYFVGTVGSQGACRFSVLARVSGGRAHAVSGVATKGTSSGSGDATFTISGNTNAYGKIFDYICVGPNNSYGIFIRSVYTGTIDVGIEFVNSDGNTVPGNFAQGSYGSIDYGGAGL